MKEEWRLTDVPGYAVSNFGRVKSLARSYRRGGRNIAAHWITSEEKILKPVLASRYWYVELRDPVREKYIRNSVHRLVALAFHDNPEGKLEVNHLDENRSNNRADNLKWATRLENVHHSADLHGGEKYFSRFRKFGAENPWATRVLKTVNDRATRIYGSLAEASKDNNIPRTTLGSILQGRLKQRNDVGYYYV